MTTRAPAASPFTLAPDGYFRRSGRPIVPVGVNYWPGSCGVEMWRAWPADEIQRDLDLVRSLGLNCVRFFVRWQDFEPASGRYDPRMFTRLRALLDWHRARGLLAHPSLFVGWMSGGIFWPHWHAERNVFSDSILRRRAAALTEAVASICAEFPETVLAIDHGNELCCLPQATAARPAEVAIWCGEISAAVKRVFPSALVVSGNEQTQVNADSGWRFGQQPGCDFYSMHAYPFPGWHTLRFDGMADPLGQSLLPFYTACARGFGPVMVQEFGTLLTSGRRQCDAYLRAVLNGCWAAGANGFLWWCLRDIAACGHPYDQNAFEGLLGLVDRHDRVKPALRYFLDFARRLADQPKPAAATIAVLWPDEYYPRDNPANPGNQPEELSRALAIAHFCLTALGHRPRIVRIVDLTKDSGLHTLVIAGAKLTAPEVRKLEPWVRAGGRVIWHGLDSLTWGADTIGLIGATPVDFCAPSAGGIKAFGRRWSFSAFSRDVFLQVTANTARVVARDQRGRPMILSHRVGAGVVASCLAWPEAEFACGGGNSAARRRWLVWYRGMLGLAEMAAGKRRRSGN